MNDPLLTQLYLAVRRGLPSLDVESPDQLAARVRARAGDLDEAARTIVVGHVALGASQGFLLGLPGLLLLPATLPANLMASAIVQMHLTASLAALTGQSLDDPAVRDRCVRCLVRATGDGLAREEAQELATRTAMKMAERGARWAGERMFRPSARSALRGVGARSMPLLGGFIGGVSDGWQVWVVARAALEEFPTRPSPVPPPTPPSRSPTTSTEKSR